MATEAASALQLHLAVRRLRHDKCRAASGVAAKNKAMDTTGFQIHAARTPFVALAKKMNTKSDVQMAMALANTTTLSHRGIRNAFEGLPSLVRPKPSFMSLISTTGSIRETTS